MLAAAATATTATGRGFAAAKCASNTITGLPAGPCSAVTAIEASHSTDGCSTIVPTSDATSCSTTRYCPSPGAGASTESKPNQPESLAAPESAQRCFLPPSPSSLCKGRRYISGRPAHVAPAEHSDSRQRPKLSPSAQRSAIRELTGSSCQSSFFSWHWTRRDFRKSHFSTEQQHYCVVCCWCWFYARTNHTNDPYASGAHFYNSE